MSNPISALPSTQPSPDPIVSFLRKLPASIKWAAWLMVVLLVVMLVHRVTVLSNFLMRPAGPELTDVMVIRQVVPAAKLITVQSIDFTTADFSSGDVQWVRSLGASIPSLFGRTFHVQEAATLSAGFDLDAWTSSANVSVSRLTRSIHIRNVPSACLLSVDPDERTLQIIPATGVFRSSSLTGPEVREVSKLVAERFTSTARVRPLSDRAAAEFERRVQTAFPGWAVKVDYVPGSLTCRTFSETSG